MANRYRILVENDNRCAWSPDFRKRKRITDNSNLPIQKLIPYLQEWLIEEKNQCLLNNYAIPAPVPLIFSDSRNSDKGIWVEVDVEFNIKKGFFNRSLPKVGMISNLLVTAVTAFLTFLSLQLNFEINQLSYSGACVSFFVLMMQYHIIGGSEMLAIAGKRIDSFVAGESTIPTNSLGLMRWYFKTLYIVCELALPLLGIVFSLISAILIYEQIISIEEKAEQEGILSLSPTVTTVIACTTAILSILPTVSTSQSLAVRLLQIIKDGVKKLSQEIQSEDIDENTALVSKSISASRTLRSQLAPGPSRSTSLEGIACVGSDPKFFSTTSLPRLS